WLDATVSSLDPRRIGRAFEVPALAGEQYEGKVNATVVAQGSGTRPDTMQLTAHGTVTDSSIFGATLPQLSFEAAGDHDRAHVTRNGDVGMVDPAVATGKAAMKGSVTGALDVDGTITSLSKAVTPDDVTGTVRVTLGPSEVGGLGISNARLDAD